MAGLYNLVDGLLTPDFGKSEPNLPKVSGRYREYSRFWETDAGDWVRSSLRPAGGSRFGAFSGTALAVGNAPLRAAASRILKSGIRGA